MSADKHRLLRLAEEVADGTPVDWDSESQSDDGLQGAVQQLRCVERLGARYRRIEEEETRSPWAEDEGVTDAPGFVLPDGWGPLRVLGKIGEGGFGEVFRAYDPNLDREVALKLLHPRPDRTGPEDERFLDEARKLARVQHPNVVVVHGADRHDGRVGLWTDLLRGRTLEEILREQGPMGAQEATLVGIDVCHALAAVHAAGLVHRDVKTSNVMRESGGRIVLLDFSAVAEAPGSGRSEDGERRFGTPAYAAPELFGGREATAASDVYSLGVVLYRLVSGAYPVDPSGAARADAGDRRETSMPLRSLRPDLPASFVRVVERALRPDPADRFPGVAEMEQALAGVLGADVPPSSEGRTPSRGRRAVLAAAAAVVVLAVGAGGYATWRQWFGPLRVDASLFRARNDVDERLLPGGRVETGDSLFLEIEATHRVHVYVVNEDRAGDVFLLFPLPGLDLENPLPAGEVVRLPGPVHGEPFRWNVTSAGGEETVLVIVSRNPLESLEHELERLPRAGSDGPMRLEQEAVDRVLRGIGGLSPAPESRADESAVSPGVSRHLSREAAREAGVWVWEMKLSGQGPG